MAADFQRESITCARAIVGMPVQKIPFYTLSLRELAETLVNDGFEKFRARQIFDGVYAKKIFNPREFPSIP